MSSAPQPQPRAEAVGIARRRCIAVGMGGIARVVVPALARRPWVEIAGVVDVRQDALQLGRDLLALPDGASFTELDAALAALDADTALIHTPSEWHYEQCRSSLAAGLDVLVAKPISNSFAAAERLVAQAEAAGRSLAVGQQVRYHRHYRAVARFVASGELGTPESVTLLNSKPRHRALNLTELDQPALYEMACHHFDILMAIFPAAAPLRICCDGFRPSWSVYAGPCMVNALIECSGGLHVLYHGGFPSQSDHYELRIEGTRGVLRCRGIHMSNDSMEYEFAARGGKFGRREDLDAGIGTADPFERFFDIWHEYLRGGAEPPWSGRNNLKVFALLSAAIDSIAAGGWVEVAGSERYAAAFRHPGPWAASLTSAGSVSPAAG